MKQPGDKARKGYRDKAKPSTKGKTKGSTKQTWPGMSKMWLNVLEASYEQALASWDDTAKSLVSLSAGLVTVGFAVIGAVDKFLTPPPIALISSLAGFLCFLVSAAAGIAVLFMKSLGIGQLPPIYEISSAWKDLTRDKRLGLGIAYLFFGGGVACEFAAMALLIFLG